MPAKVTFKRPAFKDQTDVINAATFNAVTAESGDVPDATTGEPGVVTLAGDFDGTGAQPKIRESLLSTFWRGIIKLTDLAASKLALGIDKVDNTPDLEKPVSGPQATAIATARNEAVSVANAHADEAARAAELTASQYAEQAATAAGTVAFTAAQNDAKQYALPDRLTTAGKIISDWNIAVDNGWYGSNSGSTKNAPFDDWWAGRVDVRVNYIIQTIWRIYEPKVIYRRYYIPDQDKWFPWERLIPHDAPADGSTHARKNNAWQKLGTAAEVDILSGTAAPVNTQGNDGDLYLQYT